MKARLLLGLAISLSATTAHADVISAATSAAALGGNDTVDFSQLGSNATPVAQSATLMSANGATVGLGFSAGPAQVCAAAGSCPGSSALSTASVWSANPSGGAGTGPITLTFGSGVSSVGADMLSSTAFTGAQSGPGYTFTASLDLYNGSTLLGTVTETSNSSASPLFVGATDSTGANITSATFSLTGIATAAQPAGPTQWYANGMTFTVGQGIYYNPMEGHIDPGYCPIVAKASTVNLTTASGVQLVLECPQTSAQILGVASQSTWNPTIPVNILVQALNAGYANGHFPVNWSGGGEVSYGATPAQPAVADTSTSDLSSLLLGEVILADAPAATPAMVVSEPGTLSLLGAGLTALLLARRRAKHG